MLLNVLDVDFVIAGGLLNAPLLGESGLREALLLPIEHHVQSCQCTADVHPQLVLPFALDLLDSPSLVHAQVLLVEDDVGFVQPRGVY
jgi:hypothetical protein